MNQRDNFILCLRNQVLKKLFLVLGLSCSVAISYADDLTSSPVYINANTGIGKLYNLPTGEWTGNVNVGYNFNQAFALEGGYNLFAGSQFGATMATNIVDVAAKGTLPLSEVFSLYGRAGVGFANDSWSGTTNVANCILCNNSIDANYGVGLVGLGGSFALDKHWDLRVEDTLYFPFSNTAAGTLMAFTFGTQYNF